MHTNTASFIGTSNPPTFFSTLLHPLKSETSVLPDQLVNTNQNRSSVHLATRHQKCSISLQPWMKARTFTPSASCSMSYSLVRCLVTSTNPLPPAPIAAPNLMLSFAKRPTTTQGCAFAGLPRRRQGFDIWPGLHIVPHFDEIPKAVSAVMRRTAGKGHTVVGVNGNTALVSVDGSFRVIGDEVTVWTPDGKNAFGPGDVPAEVLLWSAP